MELPLFTINCQRCRHPSLVRGAQVLHLVLYKHRTNQAGLLWSFDDKNVWVYRLKSPTVILRTSWMFEMFSCATWFKRLNQLSRLNQLNVIKFWYINLNLWNYPNQVYSCYYRLLLCIFRYLAARATKYIDVMVGNAKLQDY